MADPTHKSPIRIIAAAVIILATVAYLSFTGGRDNKSYYVTIGELQGMGDKAYVRHLRVAGNVAPGSIHRVGTNATFDLLEQGRKLSYGNAGGWMHMLACLKAYLEYDINLRAGGAV